MGLQMLGIQFKGLAVSLCSHIRVAHVSVAGPHINPDVNILGIYSQCLFIGISSLAELFCVNHHIAETYPSIYILRVFCNNFLQQFHLFH